jgi:hypothetical protein
MAVHAQTNRWPCCSAPIVAAAACLDHLTLDSPAACIHAYACTAVTSEEAAWLIAVAAGSDDRQRH